MVDSTPNRGVELTFFPQFWLDLNYLNLKRGVICMEIFIKIKHFLKYYIRQRFFGQDYNIFFFKFVYRVIRTTQVTTYLFWHSFSR